MRYIDTETLKRVDAQAFLAQKPFPWANLSGALTPSGFQGLCENLPDIRYFEKSFGMPRKDGQKPHDRYRLWYHQAKGKIPAAWEEFIAELHSREYKAFIRRVFGVDKFDIRIEWHYTPGGCSVTPHLDGLSTKGAHLFYFNTSSEWDSSWGGQTLVLGNKSDNLVAKPNPDFDDFDIQIETDFLDNKSLLFMNNVRSWHGVKELGQPEGVYRRLLTVFIEEPVSPVIRLKKTVRLFIKKLLKKLAHVSGNH